MIYICTFIALFLATYINNSLNRKVVFLFFILLLIFIGGFRDSSIGADTSGGYLAYFDWISAGQKLSFVEPLWVYLNKLCIYFGFGYVGVIFFAELLCIVPVLLAIKIEKIDELEGLFIYYGMYLYLHSFNLIRQCIAMSFCALAFSFFSKKHYFLFFLMMSIAFCFHKSSLIFLSFIPMLKLTLTPRKVCVLCFCTFAFGALCSQRIFILLAGSYAGYLQNSEFGFRAPSIAIKFFTMLLNILFCTYVVLAGKKSITSTWASLLALGYMCMNATMSLVLGTRLMFYFTQAQMFFYPNFFIIKQKDRLVLKITFYAYLFVNFIRILNGQWNTLVPYKSVFNS